MLKRLGGQMEIIYMDREGKLTQRRIRILAVSDEDVKAFCYTQRGPRVFRLERILAAAVIPKVQRHNVQKPPTAV
ncbi:hypothetical protein B5M42_008390 [Paenibacillus athensensis]|uniref:WYL domain-containing protein n=1 Tax=Paenibacillus athensensis TaxID=1967502 RepID=A0A4Y8PW94_9BACL|nr:hypothetical protein [Paenibacillus athensensis]